MVLMVDHTNIQSSALHGGAFSRSSSTTSWSKTTLKGVTGISVQLLCVASAANT